MGKTNIFGLTLEGIAINLGVDKTTLLNLKYTDRKSLEQFYFIKNYVEGGRAAEIDYRRGNLLGLPILNRYLYLSYVDPSDPLTDHSFFSDTIIIKVNRTNKIEKTEVKGLNSTMKEFINCSDYNIEITGTIFGPNAYQYNDNTSNALNDNTTIESFLYIVNTQSNITIQNSFLNEYFKVTNIVVDDFDCYQSTDYVNAIYFKIKATSDDPNFSIINQNI